MIIILVLLALSSSVYGEVALPSKSMPSNVSITLHSHLGTAEVNGAKLCSLLEVARSFEPRLAKREEPKKGFVLHLVDFPGNGLGIDGNYVYFFSNYYAGELGMLKVKEGVPSNVRVIKDLTPCDCDEALYLDADGDGRKELIVECLDLLTSYSIFHFLRFDGGEARLAFGKNHSSIGGEWFTIEPLKEGGVAFLGTGMGIDRGMDQSFLFKDGAFSSQPTLEFDRGLLKEGVEVERLKKTTLGFTFHH